MSTEVFGFGLRLCALVFQQRAFSRRARVQSQVERSEPKGNLDGFLARLHDSEQKESKVDQTQRGLAPQNDWELLGSQALIG